ncbi:MAG TPA: hypothetical protein VMT66_01590 [Steroidobacteraceae bacterium]|nr:hypothetical protein [Steroidobacteraceae bacterium]
MYDPVTGHIFVNVQTRAELIEIDPLADRVIGRIALPGADGNHGLLIDPRQRLAFIACEGNHKLLVLDMRTRKVTQGRSALPIVVSHRSVRRSWARTLTWSRWIRPRTGWFSPSRTCKAVPYCGSCVRR